VSLVKKLTIKSLLIVKHFPRFRRALVKHLVNYQTVELGNWQLVNVAMYIMTVG